MDPAGWWRVTVLRVRQALARIHTAWPHLDDHRDAATARRRPEPRSMGWRTAASLDALLKLERAEREGRQARLSAPSPAPANLDLVDAETATIALLRDLCWLSANVLRGPWLPGEGFWTPRDRWTVQRGLWTLHHAAPWWPDQLLADAGHDLAQAADVLDLVLQLDRHDGEVRHGRETWVTAERACAHFDGVTVTNVRDWRRRGLVVDEHGVDRSLISQGRRWYPLADLRRAARSVGRDAPKDEAA